MTRIEQEPKTATVVSRKDFDADRTHGFVCLEYNPEREITIKDRTSGRSIRQVLLADIMFRCVECQFDTLDRKLIEMHLIEGKHPWAYTPFESPYGNVGYVVIEGIEDYAAFLKAEKGE